MEQAMVFRLLGKLGVTAEDLGRVRALPYPESARFLGELKERVKKNWRKLAGELHPDVTGNDPEKTEEFVRLNRVREDFEKLVVAPAPPPPVVFVPFRRPSYAARPFTNSATTTTVNPWYAARMRPTLEVVFVGEPLPLAFAGDGGLGPFLVFLDGAALVDGFAYGGSVAFEGIGPGGPSFGAVRDGVAAFDEGLEELGDFLSSVVDPQEDGGDLGAVREEGESDPAPLDVRQLRGPPEVVSFDDGVAFIVENIVKSVGHLRCTTLERWPTTRRTTSLVAPSPTS